MYTWVYLRVVGAVCCLSRTNTSGLACPVWPISCWWDTTEIQQLCQVLWGIKMSNIYLSSCFFTTWGEFKGRDYSRRRANSLQSAKAYYFWENMEVRRQEDTYCNFSWTSHSGNCDYLWDLIRIPVHRGIGPIQNFHVSETALDKPCFSYSDTFMRYWPVWQMSPITALPWRKHDKVCVGVHAVRSASHLQAQTRVFTHTNKHTRGFRTLFW